LKREEKKGMDVLFFLGCIALQKVSE
jgi:hypothetical protein